MTADTARDLIRDVQPLYEQWEAQIDLLRVAKGDELHAAVKDYDRIKDNLVNAMFSYSGLILDAAKEQVKKDDAKQRRRKNKLRGGAIGSSLGS